MQFAADPPDGPAICIFATLSASASVDTLNARTRPGRASRFMEPGCRAR